MNFMFVRVLRVLRTEVVQSLGFLQFLLRVLEVSLEVSVQSFRILGLLQGWLKGSSQCFRFFKECGVSGTMGVYKLLEGLRVVRLLSRVYLKHGGFIRVTSYSQAATKLVGFWGSVNPKP